MSRPKAGSDCPFPDAICYGDMGEDKHCIYGEGYVLRISERNHRANIIFNEIRRRAKPNILSSTTFDKPVANLAPRKPLKKKPRHIRPAVCKSTNPAL
jgi:hypothetical protein